MIRRAASLAVLCLLGCRTASPPPATPPERPSSPVEVLLLPVGDFSYDLSTRLARDLSRDVGVQVWASLPMGAGDLQRSGDQYVAEDIVAHAAEVAARVPDRHSPSIAIALTVLDINERGGTLRFVFAHRDPESHTSVLSVARMGDSTSAVTGTPEQLYARLYKMTKRAIGEQYLALERTSDLGNVMYAPILSLEDIDAMGTQFPHHPVPRGRMSLAPPPAGYAWREVPAIAAAVLVPDGWHVHEERRGQTYAVFVAPEEIDPAKNFETGFTLNVFLDNPVAPVRLVDTIRGVAARYSGQVYGGTHDVMLTIRCEVDLPRDGGREPIHAFYLGLVNRKTRTSYLMVFESPASRWTEAWKTGLPVLDEVRFATDL